PRKAGLFRRVDRTAGIPDLWPAARRPRRLSPRAARAGAEAGGSEISAQLHIRAKRSAGGKSAASRRRRRNVRFSFETRKLDHDRVLRCYAQADACPGNFFGNEGRQLMGFSEFLGNERIVLALRGALRSGRVPHALLFTGPRGVGKFTLARMFAQAANCERMKDDFCGECATCQRISLLADPQKLVEQGLAERGESSDAAP